MKIFFLTLILSISTLLYPSRVIEGYDKLDIGVCYGFLGNDLPPVTDAVRYFKKYGIGKMRIFEPNKPMMDALRKQDIDLTVGVRNQDIPLLASSQVAAEKWFNTNVLPYVVDLYIPYIAVGNEVIPGEFSDKILPAMKNLQNVLKMHGFAGIKATTVVHLEILGSTFPPSATKFLDKAQPFMKPILQFLSATGAPLLINVYPYFAYAANSNVTRLDYAQFTAPGPVVQDGILSYTNLFDAMVDSFVWAMEQTGVTDVALVVSESGWPHDGNGDFTDAELARTYNQNFMNHILAKKGTPKRPGAYIEGFIFAMCDENQKPDGVEQHFGMFKPNLAPNYDIFS